MKLKKIASLALAGIMAVSMLTACGEGGSSSSEPTNPVVPAASNVAGYMNQLLSASKSDKVVFSDDEALRNAVNAVALKADVVKPDMIAAAYDKDEVFNINGDASVTKKVVEEFKSGTFTTTLINTWREADPANNEKTDYYLIVDLVDGEKDEFAVADSIVNACAATIGSFPDKTTSGANVVWDGSVAAVKVYNSKDATKSAWVVGVMFTKTVTNGTNTQV